MSSFVPALDAALQQSYVRVFTAVQVIFPDHTINLIDGSGFLSFGGYTFTGSDPIYGTLGAITSLGSAFATQAPTAQITFLPPSNSGFAALNNTLYQGAPVNIWLGVLDPVAGVVGTPYQLFAGVVDYCTSTVSTTTQNVTMSIASVFDRMFVADEAARLNSQYHQSIHPGEIGLNYNIQALAEPFWGQSAATNPTYPTLPIAATLSDQLSGQTQGGRTYGNVWPGI